MNLQLTPVRGRAGADTSSLMIFCLEPVYRRLYELPCRLCRPQSVRQQNSIVGLIAREPDHAAIKPVILAGDLPPSHPLETAET
jgi:hypothetical protein